MARRPFFGQNDTKIAKMDMQAATAPGRAYAAAFKGLGEDIGGAIEKYQLNKEKREAEERTAMGNLAGFSPEELAQISSSNPQLGKAIENAMSDKATPKDFQLINASSAPIVAGKTRRLKEENAQIKNQIDSLNLEVGRLLKDPKVRTAVAEASTAESNAVTADAKASYADSIASAEYSKKIADTDLTRAQTEYYEAKSKAEEKTDSYKPGQRVDIEGASGNKVSFVWTGNSLQPLNDSVSKRSIDEAIIRGVDPAAMKVYLEDNYDYNEDTELYTFKGKSNMVGYGGGQKDPMMERAITILGMRGQVNDEDLPSDSSKEESAKIEPTIDEHKSANEKAKSSGKMFYIINGEKYKVQ
jgi:hypothetical protein